MNDWLPVRFLPTAWLVGWTLLHFVWQATLVAGLTGLVLGALSRRAASTRYAVCVAGLVALAAAPVVTLLVLTGAEPARLPPLALATLLVTHDLRQELNLLVPGVSVLWCAGVVLMNVRLAAQLIGVRMLARDGHAPLPEPVRGAVRALCRSLGMRRPVDVVLSSRAAVPMVVGWLRPVVLVPAAALAGLSTAQLRAVLAHELAHVRRHDALVNLAQTVLETLFFFHPAVWWLSHRARVEREFCCDDVAVDTCGDRLTYAKALAALDDLRAVRPEPALAATGGSLMQRIARLLDAGASRRTARPLAGWLAPAVATLALTAAVTAMAPAHDEEQAQPLAGVDLVEVVAPVDGELAEILGVLRESGLDDATLLEVVSRMGTSPDVLDAIEVARRRAEVVASHRKLEKHLAEAKASVHADLEAGLITPEEAKLRMADAHREVEAWVASQGGKQAVHDAMAPRVKVRTSDGAHVEKVHAHLRLLEEKAHAVHRKIREGLLPAEEGQAIMEKLHHELKKANAPILETPTEQRLRVRTKLKPVLGADATGDASLEVELVPEVVEPAGDVSFTERRASVAPHPAHAHGDAHENVLIHDLPFGDAHGDAHGDGVLGELVPDHDHAVHPHAEHDHDHAHEIVDVVTEELLPAGEYRLRPAVAGADDVRLGLEKLGWVRLVQKLDEAQLAGEVSDERVRAVYQVLTRLEPMLPRQEVVLVEEVAADG